MTAHDRAGERPDACPRCHGTGKDPAGFGSPDPWACMTCGGAGERADAIPEAAVEAMVEDFLPRYVHKWETLPNQWEHRKWWRREFGRLLAVAAPFLRAAHPEAGSEEAERLDERARINARYAGKLSAERDEARSEADRLIQTQRELITERNAAWAEVERLRDAARAFVRETGGTHPAIARIPADAPAAVRYNDTRAALLALLDAHPEADRAPEDCAVCGGTGGGAAGMCPACGGTGYEADRAPDHDPACVLPHGHSGLCQAAPSSEADRAPEDER